MSVSNYIPNACLYRIDKLDDVVYLIPEQTLRNIKIDNGEAYIENIQYQPLVFNCYDISLEDTESLDERYEFSHTLKFSINGYVNHNDFNGNYYAIVKSMDNEYWLVNPKFPCKVTYTYTLGYNDSHTDFTLSTISNHPTLRIRNMNQVRPYPCSGYTLDGFDQLLLNEKDYSARYGNYVRYTNSGFSEVRYDKKSATFTEEFDGTNVSHTIQFNIKFDDYKDSWHYNLLEFTDNLYSAVIKTSGKEYVLCGFGFGLQPSYTVTSNGEVSTPDHIQIVLKDSHNNGDLITFITGGTISPITGQTTFQFTTDYDGWECVGDGVAKYLLQKEYDAFGNPTGRYKCLQGYEEQFSYLNLAGTFDEIETFDQPLCKIKQCNLYTSLLSPLNVYAQQCTRFHIKADSDWRLVNTASFLQFSPTSGEANVEYTVDMCNSRAIDAASISSAFTIQYCDTATTYNVNIFPRNACFYNGDERTITSDGQYVIFPTQCCTKEATEYSGDTLTDIQLMQTYIKIYVPQNTTETPRTFVVTVTLCNGDTATLIIHQGNGFYRWVTESTTCVGTQKCDVQRMYSGTTSGDINTRTEVLRTTNCVESTDCSGSEKRWVVTEETVCYNGRKYVVEAEQVKPSADSPWIDTGQTRRGSETSDSPAECQEIVYEYRWVTAETTTCVGYDKYQQYKKQQRISGSSDAWVDVVPTTYSYNGEGTMTPILVESASTDCGYVPPTEPQYKWVRMDITTDYICDECPTPQYRTLTTATTCVGVDKYELDEYQVSYDSGTTWTTTATSATTLIEANSTDCGYSARTLTTGWTCQGYDKYGKAEYQVSYDSGVTWTTTATGVTTLIEANSSDCGYIPPLLDLKFYATYSDNTSYSAECESETGLTYADVTPNGYVRSAMTSAVIGDCISGLNYYNYSSISGNVTSGTFQRCTSLTSATISNSVKTIGEYAFNSCSGLTRINSDTDGVFNIPEGVLSIRMYAFAHCPMLKHIVFPSTVTYMEVGTVSYSNNIESITILATTPPNTDSWEAPLGVNRTIYVPSGSVQAYKTAKGWSGYSSYIQAIPNS